MKNLTKRHLFNLSVLLLVISIVAIQLPEYLAQERVADAKLARLQAQLPALGTEGNSLIQPLASAPNLPSIGMGALAGGDIQDEFAAGEEEDPAARDRWFSEQRAFPKAEIPAGVLRTAVEQELAASPNRMSPQQAAQWTNIGPAPLKEITYGGTTAHDTSGRALTVAIHPSDPNTILLGTAQGGIWKSTDGGANFRSVSENTLPSLAIKVIRYVPNNPQIVYAGTGEPHGSTGIYGMGVIKSTDGGETWQSLPRKGQGWDFEYAYISGLQIDPANPNTLYVSTAIVHASATYMTSPNDRPGESGIYKSTDGGNSWTLLKAARKFASAFVGTPPSGFIDLELGSSELLYAAEYGGGVWKTTNAGAAWSLLTPSKSTGPGRFPAAVNDFTYHGGLFYLVKRLPLETTLENGGSLPDFGRIELGVSKANPQVVYAGYAVPLMFLDANNNNSYDDKDIQTSVGLLFKSSDGGQSWTWLGDWGRQGVPDYCASQCNYDNVVEVNPTNADEVIIGGSANYSKFWPDPITIEPQRPQRLLQLPWRGMIYRTTNGGQSWTDLTPHCAALTSQPLGKEQSTGLDVYGCESLDKALVIHPDQHAVAFDPQGRIYVGNDGGLYRASTGAEPELPTATPTQQSGQTPTATPIPGGPTATATQPAGSQYRIFLPLVTRGGGLVASQAESRSLRPAQANGGYRWTNLNKDFSTLQFYYFDVHPTNPDIILGGFQDNANGYYNGQFWDGWGYGDGIFGLFDPKDPKHVFQATQFAVHRHDDGGRKVMYQKGQAVNGWKMEIFTSANAAQGESVAFHPVFTIDPVQPNIVYGASNKGLYKSTDRGDTWAPVGTRKLGQGEGRPSWLSVSPVDHNIVYMATSVGWVFRFNAATGEAVRTGNSLPGRFVTRVQASPTDANTVYITLSGYNANTPGESGKVFKSTNRGDSWTDISGNLPDVPVSALALDPQNPNRMWVGADVGVFVTQDGGSNWLSYRNNMPVVTITDLKYHTASRKLFAGTHGRGMWTVAPGGIDPNLPTATPQPGVTVTPSSTATTGPTPTATATTPPPAPTELQDPGFETANADPWTAIGAPELVTDVKRSGNQSVKVESYWSTEGVYQQVRIPDNATAVTLEFAALIETDESDAEADDLCIYLSEGVTRTGAIGGCIDLGASGSTPWDVYTYNLKAEEVPQVRGKTLYFTIDSVNDFRRISTVWVDDTDLRVTTGGLLADPSGEPAPSSSLLVPMR